MSIESPTLTPDEEGELARRYELAFFRPPSEAAPTEAELECNRLLAALKDVRDEVEANRRLRDAEVQNADRWLERVNEAPRRKEAWLLLMLEAVAPFVPRYGNKKSRDLPRGTIGWRTAPERLAVENEEAVLSWATANGVQIKTDHSVIMKELARAWKARREREAGYVPPGCRLVEAEERFYVDPLDVS